MERLLIKEKKSHTANIILTVILIIAIGVTAFAGRNLYSILHEYKEGSDEYAKIQDMVVIEKEAREEEKSHVQNGEKKVWDAPIDVDFDSLLAINPDIAGWLYVESIPQINYPVVKGNDNDYYLHHTFEKQDNFAGSIFIDCENEKNMEDCNTIIYGHNMRNGSMFGSLKQFKLPETYKNSNVIWLLTPEGDYKYEVFSTYTAAVGSETYTLFKGPGDAFAEYETHMAADNQLPEIPPRDLAIKDKIITLSTCTGDDATRYVVQAVKVDP